MPAQVICIGSVLWDIVGRTPRNMALSNDVPGRILRLPGGVALNIAQALAKYDLSPVALTAIGQDTEGDDLMKASADLGLDMQYVHRPDDLPTDCYMAIEGANGLIAAIADAHSLEAAGDAILAPLTDGRLGSETSPFSGVIALDGNLTLALLQEIAQNPLFSNADLRIAPASPGKAERLRPFLTHSRGTLYVNLEEAGILVDRLFDSSQDAVRALLDAGAARVMVTHGGRDATFGTPDLITSQTPPKVNVTRITGAGDTFMAAHIAAEIQGASPSDALNAALAAAASYVSGDTILS